MSRKLAANAIRERFGREIEDKEGLSTLYDNFDEDVPDDEDADSTDEQWCRLTLKFGEAIKISTGKQSRKRIPGVAFAQLFTPTGCGDGLLLEIADKVVDAFEWVTETIVEAATSTTVKVKFQTPTVLNIGRVGDVWQINVEIPFDFDIVS